MDPVENHRTTANEVISLGRQHGIDLEPLCTEGHFQTGCRWISLWRKDEFPYSGPANMPLGTLRYNMQGAIALLPNRLKDSASAFQGSWHETGSFADLQQALEFLKAWLIDKKEVDELPERAVRSYGI